MRAPHPPDLPLPGSLITCMSMSCVLHRRLALSPHALKSPARPHVMAPLGSQHPLHNQHVLLYG